MGLLIVALDLFGQWQISALASDPPARFNAYADDSALLIASPFVPSQSNIRENGLASIIQLGSDLAGGSAAPAAPTATPAPPTVTPVPATATSVPVTPTSVPATATPIPPTATLAPTSTPIPPTATPVPPTPTATSAPPGTLSGTVTHYGTQFEGLPLGCGGLYASANPSIIAVGPDHYQDWPCGTYIHVCGPASCIIGERVDSCPGCAANQLDLSEAGIAIVCGEGVSRCNVAITPLL